MEQPAPRGPTIHVGRLRTNLELAVVETLGPPIIELRSELDQQNSTPEFSGQATHPPFISKLTASVVHDGCSIRFTVIFGTMPPDDATIDRAWQLMIANVPEACAKIKERRAQFRIQGQELVKIMLASRDREGFMQRFRPILSSYAKIAITPTSVRPDFTNPVSGNVGASVGSSTALRMRNHQLQVGACTVAGTKFGKKSIILNTGVPDTMVNTSLKKPLSSVADGPGFDKCGLKIEEIRSNDRESHIELSSPNFGFEEALKLVLEIEDEIKQRKAA